MTQIPEPESISLIAADGRRLAATYYAPMGDAGLSLQINSATAVPRRYYDAFARHMAARGIAVLTFDYRGIGESRGGPAEAMEHWGALDAVAATDWLLAQRPNAGLALLGHSFGGQVLGLSPHIGKFKAVMLVGSQSGYWRHWPGLRAKLRMLTLWYLLIPVLTRLQGQMPGAIFGGEPLPRGVALQWARWGRSRHYISDQQGQPLRPYNHLLRSALLSLSFSDDTIAPRQAADALMDYYPQAQVERRHVAPGDWGLQQIGHFGFFRRAMPVQYWDMAADWLLHQSGAMTRAA